MSGSQDSIVSKTFQDVKLKLAVGLYLFIFILITVHTCLSVNSDESGDNGLHRRQDCVLIGPLRARQIFPLYFMKFKFSDY